VCGLEFSPVLNLQQAVAETSNLSRQLQRGVETFIRSDRMGALPCNCARGCNYKCAEIVTVALALRALSHATVYLCIKDKCKSWRRLALWC